MNKSVSLLAGVVVSLAPAALAQAPTQTPSDLRFGGDLRVRYEHTARGNGALALGREVVRFRLGATYSPQPDLTVRARIATGDPDDPNSTDVTVGSFVNDLAFSLDLAAVELSKPTWGVFAGKFTNPFLTTELVWDGDVNPQGAGGRLKLGTAGGVTATLTGMFFVVDQQSGDTSSSDMGGAQVSVATAAGRAKPLSAMLRCSLPSPSTAKTLRSALSATNTVSAGPSATATGDTSASSPRRSTLSIRRLPASRMKSAPAPGSATKSTPALSATPVGRTNCCAIVIHPSSDSFEVM